MLSIYKAVDYNNYNKIKKPKQIKISSKQHCIKGVKKYLFNWMLFNRLCIK